MSSACSTVTPIDMEESSDTSREDVRGKSLHSRLSFNHRPSLHNAQRSIRNPPSPVGSLSHHALPSTIHIHGSPYSTAIREYPPANGSMVGYSVWGSDSSQLYRSPSSGKGQKENGRFCSTLLIVTATLVVLTVMAIAAVAAYLGVMTNHSDSDKYEIRFDSSMRVVRGDNFRASLNDFSSEQFRVKAERYRRWIDTVYKSGPLSEAYRRCSIEKFTNGSLVVHFQLYFDRRKIPPQVGETESAVQDVLVQEVMAVEPVAFKRIVVDIDSIRVTRYIPSGPSLGLSQRWRAEDNEVYSEDLSQEDENNIINNNSSSNELGWSVNSEEVASTTMSDLEIPVTSTAEMEDNVQMAPEPVPSSEAPSSTHSYSDSVTNETDRVVSTSPKQTHTVSYDQDDWVPMIVKQNHALPKDDGLAVNHNPVVSSDNVEAFNITANVEVKDRETQVLNVNGLLKSNTSSELNRKPESGETERGDSPALSNSSSNVDSLNTAATTTSKYSFINWLNSQISNAVSNRRLPVNSSSETASPEVTSSSPPVRFFTVRPTAVSYSGIRPVARPKPSPDTWPVFPLNDTSTATFSVVPRASVDEAGAVSAFAPNPDRSIQVQAVLELRKELASSTPSGKLVESPRSQKSLDMSQTRGPTVIDTASTSNREIQQQQVELLKDFFPPVRRPVARPQSGKNGMNQPEAAFESLPLEGLFATLKPTAGQQNNKHRSSSNNSPIYTFKLSQGQSVHDVLPQLLADLSNGESPANLEVPSFVEESQQAPTDYLTLTNNKKIDDDRLKPWSQTPFRPAVLNTLNANSLKTNTTAELNGIHENVSTLPPTGSQESDNRGNTTAMPILLANSSSSLNQLDRNSSHVQVDCEGQFSCSNGECVSPLARCNQMNDCRDGSDELNCTCADFLRAQFLTRKICDGVVDCWDYSDENQCEWCQPGQYICINSKTCINTTSVCNGVVDCPNGDDERHCVALAHQLDSEEEVTYEKSGYLMVRREGRWGKFCMQNFETAVENLRQSFQVTDLGKAVCQELTFTGLEKAERKLDVSRSDHDQTYYELVETSNDSGGIGSVEEYDSTQEEHYEDDDFKEKPRASTLDYTTSKCSKRQVVHIKCRDLECGIRPRLVSSRARIVGGANSTPGAWPWQAALYKEGDFQCGATLISDRWLVSAGHCFYHAQDDYWVARLGALRRGSNLLSPHEQVRVISHIFIHPGYIDTGFVNDISILRMEEPVQFTDYVRPVCLPPPTADIRDGRLCTVIGWGQLYETGRVFPDTLQQVQLPLVSTEECRKRTLFLPLYRLTNNMFCAGYDRGGRDACLGDSGGPLMCEEPDGRWTLQGVTSNGYGCARANRPGVYTKVARYVSWIGQVINGTYRGHRRSSDCYGGHRCILGQCLPFSHVCNGITECSDGSDEKNCKLPTN